MAGLKTKVFKPTILAPEYFSQISEVSMENLQRQAFMKKFNFVRILLEKYRDICWSVNDDISQRILEAFVDDTICDCIENIPLLVCEEEIGLKKKVYTPRLTSIKKTRYLLNVLVSTVNVLEDYPNNGKVLKEIIYMSYLSKEKISSDDITKYFGFESKNQMKQARQKAISLITLLFWGKNVITDTMFGY